MENRPLRVPATDTPQFANREGAVGFSIGYLASLGQRSLLGALALPILGWVGGGLYGKEKMKRERHEGRVVHPPSLLNTGTLIGATDGMIFGSLFTIVTGGIGWPVGLALALGTLYGVSDYKRTSDDYRAAQRYVAQHGEYNPHALQHHAARPEMLTPEESMMLQERLAAEGKHRSFATNLAQQTHELPTEPTR